MGKGSVIKSLAVLTADWAYYSQNDKGSKFPDTVVADCSKVFEKGQKETKSKSHQGKRGDVFINYEKSEKSFCMAQFCQRLHCPPATAN